jgi:2-hydroxychromene-2-carboxylate isomerase
VTAIDVYIDFKSPAAYLAVEPTAALAAETGASVNWLPFDSRQRSVPDEQPNESKGETHIRIRAEYRERAAKHYAEIQGLPMNVPKVPGETAAALVGLLLAPSLDYVRLAFRGYWADGLDLDDRQVVNTLLHEAHAECELPNADECAERMAGAMDQAIERGIIDVPAYAVGEELFVGREHLPWIRELVDG